MRLLLTSRNGQGLGLAMHIASEGHAVCINVTSDKGIGEGILDAQSEEFPDIALFDDEEFGSEADQLRRIGMRVLGSSSWSSMLETNPDYSRQLIEAIGWSPNSVHKGVNLYVTAWFNGANYISTYAGMVYRRFLSDGRGPDINMTGAVANFWQPTERIKQAFLNPLVKVLRRANHRGCFHIHAVVDGDKFSVPEVSASFSSPLTNLLYENCNIPPSAVLLRLLNEDSKLITPLEQWAISIMASVPPFPHTVHSLPTPLLGIIPANLKHLWLVDAMKASDLWQTAGRHGKIGYVTARGASISEASRRAYRTIKNLQVPDLQYRSDIGRNVEEYISHLRRWGWLKEEGKNG